jgi:hypothetical protein
VAAAAQRPANAASSLISSKRAQALTEQPMVIGRESRNERAFRLLPLPIDEIDVMLLDKNEERLAINAR